MTQEQHEAIMLILDCIEKCSSQEIINAYHEEILKILRPKITLEAATPSFYITRENQITKVLKEKEND